MNMTLGFLAMALLGSDSPAPSPTSASADSVRLRVRMLEMKGIEWRGTIHNRLAPAARQGTACVWTANQDVVGGLERSAEQSVLAPEVSARLGVPASVKKGELRRVVADLRRRADGPPGENTCVGFFPEVDNLLESFDVEMTCRAVDQGVMARVAVNSTHLTAMPSYTVEETVTQPKTGKTNSVNARVQVPVMVSGRAAGEWLIPTDGVLIVGLGPYSAADAQGKAVVRERIVVIEPVLPKDDSSVSRAAFETRNPAAVRGWTSSAAVATAHASPMPIGPSMILPLASPTIAPPARGRVVLGSGAHAWSVPFVREGGSTSPAIELPRGTSILDLGKAPAPTIANGALLIWALPLPTATLPVASFHVAFAPKVRAAMPMAVPPSRDLPTPLAADGSIVPLPPLPEDDDPTEPDPSAEPRPTLQSRPARANPTPAEPAPLAQSVLHLQRELHIRAQGKGVEIDRTGDETRKGVSDDLVLFPAPKPVTSSGAADCPEDGNEKVAASRLMSRIAPLPHLRSYTGFTPGRLTAALAPSHPAAAVHDSAKADPDVDQCLAEEGGSTLGLQLNSATGASQYEAEVSLRTIANGPLVVRVPMADGTIVEVQARVVKKDDSR